MFKRTLDKGIWGIAGALGVALLAAFAGIVSAGPLEPPAAPAPTGPTAIYQPASFPIIITTPGSYYLASDITGVAGLDGIRIGVDNVTLDLNGFAMIGVPGSGVGIENHFGGCSFAGSICLRNIVVKNGTVRDWGSYGVHAGYWADGQYSDLRLFQNGVGIEAGVNSIIQNVTARANVSTGIAMAGFTCCGGPEGRGIVKDSVSESNGTEGFRILDNVIVSNVQADHNGTDGILVVGTGNRIEANNVSSNGGAGIGVTGFGNTIFKNSAHANGGGDYAIGGGNDAGPIGTAAAAVSAWANITY